MCSVLHKLNIVGGGYGDFTDGVIRSVTEVFSVFEDVGADDVIYTGNGDNVAIGGNADDEIHGGNERDIIVSRDALCVLVT